MKSGFWKTDWFLGLAVVVAFVVFNRSSDLPGLAAFLERALAKNPDARFQTGEEFGGALRAALAAGAPRPAAAARGGVDIEL